MYLSRQALLTERPVTYAAAPVVRTSREAGYTTRPAFRVKRADIARPFIQFIRPAGQVYRPRRKLALLLPGHNEELIIATTIQSAIASGQDKRDIYVVDDASTDDTCQIAESILGEENVLSVERSGKALAVHKAIKNFEIEKQYEWLHVADADSIFSASYFRIYKQKLSNEHVVALGFVQSLRGNWIATYRSFSYTYGQHIGRRIQAFFGMIPVFPGPVTSFRTDILSQLEITGDSLTEDFDITLQVHRKNLGKILYIPGAVNYTQDPQNLRDFCKQSMRWYRGFFQGIRKYRIGFGKQKIDVGIGFQLLQTFIFLAQISILYPLVLLFTHRWIIIPAALALNLIIVNAIILVSAITVKRWNMLGVLPYYYFLQLLELSMYFTACVEVLILKRFQGSTKGWSTEGRRYNLAKNALQDIPQVKPA